MSEPTIFEPRGCPAPGACSAIEQVRWHASNARDLALRVIDLEMALHAIRREVKFSPGGPFPRARILALCNEQLTR